MRAFDEVSGICKLVYEDSIDAEDAPALLMETVSHEEACEFIIDAFNRGWITIFNLGIER